MTDPNKLHSDSRALLESLADRFTEGRLAKLRTFSEVGEWTELVNGICATLTKRQIPITTAERDDLAAVLAMFDKVERGYDFLNDKDATLAALNVVG